MVQVKKVLNSSVVLVEDENDSEYIVISKGLGYGRKSGEVLDIAETTYQVYIPVASDKTKQIAELLSSITPEILDITHKVISLAKDKLHTDFNNNVYFVLADHINFAFDRLKQGMNITNRLTWEIQSFYPEVYEVAKDCLALINKEMNVEFPEDEAVNIAFHLLNAHSSNDPEYDSARYAKLLGELVNMVRYSLNKNLKQDSIHYIRFITHIRFFVERFFTDRMLEDHGDSFYLSSKGQYQKEAEIANKMKNYLYEKYQKLITDEEMSFLIIHINRMLREN